MTDKFDSKVFQAAQQEWLRRWPQLTGVGLCSIQDGSLAVRFFMSGDLLDEMPKEHQGMPVVAFKRLI